MGVKVEHNSAKKSEVTCVPIGKHKRANTQLHVPMSSKLKKKMGGDAQN